MDRSLISRAALPLALAGAGLLATAPRPDPPEIPGTEFVEGSFVVRYFGVRGWESYRINQLDDGWIIGCLLDPPSPDLKRSETIYYLDEDRRFERAEHREIGDSGATVSYVIEGEHLVSRGVDASGQPLPEMRVELDEHRVVSGPNYATDFFVLYPLDLNVGETRVVEAAVFGFRSWKPEPLRLTTTRRKNRNVSVQGLGRVQTLVYRSKLELDGNTTWATSYLDPETGQVHRLTIDLTIGSAKVLRE